MATTTVLANPGLVEINNVDFTDQCTSAVVTYQFDELEATAFGDTARKYTKGLQNNEITLTLMLSYGTGEVEATLEGLAGTTTTVEVVANGSTPSATSPKYTLTGCFLAGFTPINAALGTLQTVDLTFRGGAFTRAVS
jgi:hypothetical protein